MENLNSSNFDEIINKGGMIVIQFSATWCSFCKAQTPILEQLIKENSQVQAFKVDIDECPELAQKYKVKAVPNLAFFKSSSYISSNVGLTNLVSLKELINSL